MDIKEFEDKSDNSDLAGQYFDLMVKYQLLENLYKDLKKERNFLVEEVKACYADLGLGKDDWS